MSLIDQLRWMQASSALVGAVSAPLGSIAREQSSGHGENQSDYGAENFLTCCHRVVIALTIS